MLTSINLVRRQQGVGTFVNARGLTHTLGDLRSFTQVMTELGMTPEIRDVEVFSDPAPPAEALEFLPGSHLWQVKRVRVSDGRPFSAMKQSLYEVLADLGIHLKDAEEKIRAEAADEELARLLDVPVGFPLLTIHRWTSDRLGRPIEYVRSYSPGDRYEYFVKLTQ